MSDVKVVDGNAISNVETDTLKICVIERHRATGNIGKGFVKGFNLKCGAIASTVAHDSHNMIVIGTNDFDMYTAAVALIKCQGGKVVVKPSTPSTPTKTSALPYKVKVKIDSLNVRADAGVNNKITCTIKKNEVYTIIEEKKVKNSDGSIATWGRLKSKIGWLNVGDKYVTKIK